MNQELLKLYLSLPRQEREKRFANTTRVAELTGSSRRTIQFWVQIGVVDAVLIGKKYEVDLNSLTAYLSSRGEPD